jgi:mannose-6-phosphate isomerase-like protein (cupin superfamily)
MTILWKFVFVTICWLLPLALQAQIVQAKSLRPDSTTYQNVFVKKLYSDSSSTTFAIWIKEEVKPHLHKHHTEVVSVVDGKGLMTVAGETQKIKRGDLILIPPGTVHSVVAVSNKPLLVISTQSPQFMGDDRFWAK